MASSSISFSGLASGIDGDAIIKATIDAKRLTYAPVQAQIDEAGKQNKALELLNTKLLGLSDGLKDFLSLAGNGITKAGVSSDANEIGISVSSAAPATSTTISVEKLASSGTLSFSDRFSSLDSPIAPGLTGTEKLTITVGQGDELKTFEVDINSSTSLANVIEKLGTDGEGVFTATAVNLGTDAAPEFALVLKSNETGVAKGSISASASAGLSGSGILTNTTAEQAQDAEFTIAGIGKVKRPSNKISGIIPGVTFELKQANNIPIQLTVNDDRDKTTEKFGKIIGLVNELISFTKEQSKITSEKDSKGRTVNSYGDLGKTRNDDEAVSLIKGAITDAYSADGTDVRLFADLGITTQRDGTLSFDKDKFLEGLAKDPLGSAQILNQVGDKLAATDGVIAQYTRYQGIIESSKTSNDDKTKLLQDRIDTIEASIAKQEESMKLLFANLEKKISLLNSSSTALQSLSSLGSKLSK